jgi:hypothetical protein
MSQMFASNQRQEQRTKPKTFHLLKCEINAPLYLFVFLKKISNFEKNPKNTEGPLRQIPRDTLTNERVKLPLRFLKTSLKKISNTAKNPTKSKKSYPSKFKSQKY